MHETIMLEQKPKTVTPKRRRSNLNIVGFLKICSLRTEENETSGAVKFVRRSTYVGRDYKFRLKLIIVFVLIRTAACAGLI